MDTNRIIKIEELEVGDEILVACSSNIRYYKVLRKPKKTSKPLAYPSRGMPAGTLVDRWSGVRCSMKLIEEEKPRYPGSLKMRSLPLISVLQRSIIVKRWFMDWITEICGL